MINYVKTNSMRWHDIECVQAHLNVIEGAMNCLNLCPQLKIPKENMLKYAHKFLNEYYGASKYMTKEDWAAATELFDELISNPLFTFDERIKNYDTDPQRGKHARK